MAQQRKNHWQEIKVLNNFLQDPNIGRRTGLPLNINARKGSNGFDIVDDYFPDSDSEAENVPPDEELKKSEVKVTAITDEIVANGETIARNTPPEHVTPEGLECEELLSPILTGSILKSNTKDPTPSFENTKKRLMFTTAKKGTLGTTESEDQRIQFPKKTAVPEDDNETSDSEVDVVGLDEDTTANNTNETRKAKAKEMGKQKGIQDAAVTEGLDKDDNESTFLTIGKNAKNATGVEALVVEELGDDSYAMDESVVLEGTRYKSMSPEFGTSRETLASERDRDTAKPRKRGGKKQGKGNQKGGRKSAKPARSVEEQQMGSSIRGRDLRSRGAGRAVEKNGAVGKDTEVVMDEEDEGTGSKEKEEQILLVEPEKPAPRKARQTKAKRNQATRRTRQKKSGGEKEAGLGNRGKDSVVNHTVSAEQSAENADQECLPTAPESPFQESCHEDDGGKSEDGGEQGNSEKPTRRTRRTQEKRNQTARKTRQTKNVAAEGEKAAASKEEMAGSKKRRRNSVKHNVSKDEPSAEMGDQVIVATSPEVLSQESGSEDTEVKAKRTKGAGRRNSKNDEDGEEREPEPRSTGGQSEEKKPQKKADKNPAATSRRPRKSQRSKKQEEEVAVEDERQKDVEESKSPETAPSPTDESPTPVDESPTPVDESPTPVDESPTPVDESPSPVDESPTPVDESPTPVDESPSPVDESPTPVDESPTPVDESPSPVEETRKRGSRRAPAGKGTQRGRRNKQQSASTNGVEGREGDVEGASKNVSSNEERNSASDKEGKSRQRNEYFQTNSKRRAKESINLDEEEPDEEEVARPKRQKLEKEQETKKARKGRGRNAANRQRRVDATEAGNEESVCVKITATNKKNPTKAGKGLKGKPPQKRGVVDSASRRVSQTALDGDNIHVSIADEPGAHVHGGTPADTSLPAVTATKSILKSAGSWRRTSGSLRKSALRAVARRSGSDADDESYAIFTKATKRRISSVSFAPTPTIHGTLDDTDPSPLSINKLSFVSGCSSFQFTDASFTPGTATSRMSSSTSGSDASPMETSIDDSQEVTLREDVTRSDSGASGSSEKGIRRSKRTRVPPLEYWRNERIDYGRRLSGWFVKGIIKNPSPSPQVKRRKRKNAAKKSSAQKVAKTNTADDEEPSFVDDCDGAAVNTSAIVINPDNNELVSVDLFHTPQLLKFLNPSKLPTADGDPLILDKYMSHAQFGAGQFVLRPGAAKGKQHVRNDTMLFYVIQGVVEVTVHNTSAVLRSGSTFFVPQGNAYDVKNCTQKDARLFFTQIKG